jgi:hypothetical protein
MLSLNIALQSRFHLHCHASVLQSSKTITTSSGERVSASQWSLRRSGGIGDHIDNRRTITYCECHVTAPMPPQIDAIYYDSTYIRGLVLFSKTAWVFNKFLIRSFSCDRLLINKQLKIVVRMSIQE